MAARPSTPWNPVDALLMIVVPILLPLAVLFTVYFWARLGIIPGAWATLLWSESPDATAILYALTLAIEIGALWFLGRRHGARWADYGLRRFSWRWLLMVLVLYIVQIFIVVGLFALVKVLVPAVDIDQAQEVMEFGHSTWGTVLNFVSAVLIAPVVEELVFRGVVFPGFAKRMPVWLAAVFSSLVFGFLHGQVNVGIYTFILGLILCTLVRRSGSIVPGIFLHFLNNLIAFWLLGGTAMLLLWY